MAAEDPDHQTRDLFEAIARGDYPSWNVYAQVMDPKDAEQYHWNIFDMTRVWPHKDYPLRPIGKMTLNENVRIFLLSQESPRLNLTLGEELLRGYRAGVLFALGRS